MWATLKAMPLFAKVLLGLVAVGVIYNAANAGHSQRRYASNSPYSTSDASDSISYATDRSSGGPERSGQTDASSRIAQFQAQHDQLSAQAQQCMVQINQAMQQQAAAAMNGQMYNQMPPCNANMQMWTAQMAYLETEIYRAQTGDHTSTVGQITGTGSYGSQSSPSTYRGGASDNGEAAVERSTREGIRGNSMYTDESGETHELPSQPYYFRDRETGQYVGSTSGNPPNDGHDYEVLTYSPN
jgi:hypothetical protein